MVINQTLLFLIFMLDGIIIGLIFDIFRISRKTIKTIDFITIIEDFIFWILTAIILLYSIFTFNNGEIRWFIFIATIIGFILYIITVSSYIIKINVTIINFIKEIIKKVFNIIIAPFKILFNFIKKICFSPILFIIVNIKKNINILLNNMNKLFSKKIFHKKTSNFNIKSNKNYKKT